MNKVLLVTIVIGDEEYFNTYKKLFQTSQINYANKHGYDYKVVTDFLDNTFKEHNVSLYFQKSLVCSQTWSLDYDYIIYVDNDVYININSPPIHSYYDFGIKVGVVDEWRQPSEKDKSLVMHFWDKHDKTIKDYYMSSMETTIENTTTANFIVNSGVLVFQPKIHKTKMDEYYAQYMPQALNKQHVWFEQASLAIYLFNNDMYLLMDPKFNAIWNWKRSVCEVHHLPENIEEFLHENFFLHFAGRASYNQVPRLDRENTETIEPFIHTCSLGTSPHMCNTLRIINYNKTHYPFDDTCCSLSSIADCIQHDLFETYTSIHELSLLSLDIDDDKKHHFQKASVENMKKVFVSPIHKKFLIMDCNNFDDEETLNTFTNDTRRIVNILNQVTTNFQVIAYFHIVSGYSSHTVSICNEPNLTIQKIYTWTPSNNSRFEDIMDNIFFKNELINQVYN